MKLRPVWLLGSLAVVVLDSGSAAAEPRVTVKTDHYYIQGKTAAQLKDLMKRRGPKGFWAYTSWYVRWSGNCAVSLEIRHTYPRWTDRSSAPAGMQHRWDHMIANLTLHEEGHGQIGLEAAREIERSGCKGDPMDIIGKWVRHEKRYDKKTRHGMTQGVVLD